MMLKDTEKTRRVVTFLDRKEIDFLDKIGKDSLFYNGTKLPRTTILKVFIDILIHTNLDVKGIKDEKELKERIKQSLVPSNYTSVKQENQ